MLIDDAIKILTRWMEVGDAEDSGTLNQAEKLCIEALKRVKKVRTYKYDLTLILLPGETEEVR